VVYYPSPRKSHECPAARCPEPNPIEEGWMPLRFLKIWLVVTQRRQGHQYALQTGILTLIRSQGPYHTHSTYKLSEQPHMHLRVLHMAEHGSREHRAGTSRHTLQPLAAKTETPCDRYPQHAAHHAKVRKT
jgi:hypothetical protein